MLRAHLADGCTLCFDLQDERQAADWLRHVRSSKFQRKLRALTIQHRGVMYSLPKPSGYERVFMFAESLPANEKARFKGGYRLFCQVDDNRVSLMVHEAQRAARVSVSKTGQQCYNPLLKKPDGG